MQWLRDRVPASYSGGHEISNLKSWPVSCPVSWTHLYTSFLYLNYIIRCLFLNLVNYYYATRRELPGFILNRLQYAILNESWRLVADEVVSADDLDVVMRDGLGLRYAFMGK